MAQTRFVSFGAIGGISAQTPLGQTDSSMPFGVGATMDFRLDSRLSLETGLLYHRMGRAVHNGVFLNPETSVTLANFTDRGRALEIPLLVKYHLRGERAGARPFLTAGPAVRRTSLTVDSYSSILSGSSLVNLAGSNSFHSDFRKWNVDPVLGAGIDFKTGRFHVSPEARYSYWGAGKNTGLRKNQADFLLGFRF
jgi:hypothetical protein